MVEEEEEIESMCVCEERKVDLLCYLLNVFVFCVDEEMNENLFLSIQLCYPYFWSHSPRPLLSLLSPIITLQITLLFHYVHVDN
jgi:hypothetical protein